MSVFSRTTSVTLGTAIVAAPFALTAMAAHASPSTTCGGVSGAYEVLANVCEIAFDYATNVSSTFTAPAGVTHMAAVLVGAGGGANTDAGDEYGGGGGAVEYIDLSSHRTATFTITPGAGGDYGVPGEAAAENGDETTLAWDGGSATAAGGLRPTIADSAANTRSGDSGGAGLGVTGSWGASGGGASGDGSSVEEEYSDAAGGTGLSPSGLSGVDTVLFQAGVNDAVFGTGGSIFNDDFTTEITLNTDVSYANAGFGGSANNGSLSDGEDGAVYIRWATVTDASTPTLAATGAHTTLPISLGIGSVALGSVLIANGLRVRTARRSK